jgi:hypothetical protein
LQNEDRKHHLRRCLQGEKVLPPLPRALLPAIIRTGCPILEAAAEGGGAEKAGYGRARGYTDIWYSHYNFFYIGVPTKWGYGLLKPDAPK